MGDINFFQVFHARNNCNLLAVLARLSALCKHAIRASRRARIYVTQSIAQQHFKANKQYELAKVAEIIDLF
jgi:hypothetical protein